MNSNYKIRLFETVNKFQKNKILFQQFMNQLAEQVWISLMALACLYNVCHNTVLCFQNWDFRSEFGTAVPGTCRSVLGRSWDDPRTDLGRLQNWSLGLKVNWKTSLCALQFRTIHKTMKFFTFPFIQNIKS